MVVVILVESWLLVPGEQVKRYRSVGVWSRRQKNRTSTPSICARLSWISWSNLHATGFLCLGAQNFPIKRRGLLRGAIYTGKSRVEATLTKYNEIFSCHSVYSRTCPCHDRVTRNKYPLNIRYKDRVGEYCRNTCELQIWLWKGCPLQLPRLTWQMPKDGGYLESQYTTTRSDEYFRIILKWVTSWTSGCHKHNLRSHFGAYTM